MRQNWLGLGLASLVSASGVLTACEMQESATPLPTEAAAVSSQRGGPRIALGDHSATPALVKRLPDGVRAYSLISSADDLPASPGFVFGGSADGAGLLKNGDGTFSFIVNHEDNFAVSRVTLDATFKPVKGEYILNSSYGLFRLCSATLATPEEHGFGPVFLTAGESGQESMTHALDPFGAPNTSRLLSAFGHWSAENTVPLPKNAYRGKTVVLIGDDDSGTYGGQLAMYVGPQGDLESGDLYVMARTDENWRERDMVVGESYPVEFRKVENQTQLTGAQIEARAVQLNAVRFGRVEDIDYRKGAGAGREVYVNVTGQATNGANADFSRTKYGRVYRLELDAGDPTRGTISVVLDGDDRGGPAGSFQNPDNILVTRNYAYIAEDPNGYGDETHDAYLYQYNLNTGAIRVVMELDHRRDASDAATYNVGGRSRFGAWEYGAMLDVSDQLGGNGNSGTFLLAVQPHTWRSDRFRGVDGGTLRPNENQGSQILVITGLPR